jgi:hypothetical protein
LANRHLVQAGFEPSIDVRNWKDKGLDEQPSNKPMWQWQAEKRAAALIELKTKSANEIKQDSIIENDKNITDATSTTLTFGF